MAANETVFESDGKAVDVSLLATVKKSQVAYVDGWLGLTHASGDSGDSIALAADRREYQFEFPSGFSASIGDTVYVDSADLTDTHTPSVTAYSTSSGAGKVALCKLTSAVDANYVATGILMGGL